MPNEHTGLPVSGYRPQNSLAIDLVNVNKAIEEAILRMLDQLQADPAIDQKWLEFGREQIESGFMAVNRSIFKPSRVKLPDDV